MRRRGHSENAIRKVVYDNPLSFFRQCARWQEPANALENNGAPVKERAALAR
jgi:hypothetical protein